MAQLTKFDTNSLHKAFIGVDRMLDTFEHRFANQLTTSYPPHNIIKIDDTHYVIEVAVTGFTKSEISIEVHQDQLTIKGEKTSSVIDESQYLYKGLANRKFTRAFTLADHIVVKSAKIENGILSIGLELEIPEEMKPRMIEIEDTQLLTDK